MATTMHNRDLAVVLLHWNDPEGIMNMIDQIRTWGIVGVEVIIVDNASHPDLWQRVKEHLSGTSLIELGENRGFSGGFSAGLDHAATMGYEYLLMLNNDVLISGDAIAHLRDVLVSQPGLAVVGPAILEDDGQSTRHFCGGRDPGRYLQSRIDCPAETLTKELLQVGYVPGMVWLSRTSIWKHYGPFDPAYFFSGEVADFCYRLSYDGWIAAVDPAVQAVHRHETTSKERRSTLYRYYQLRNRFLFVARHHQDHKWHYYLHWLSRGMRQVLGALAQRDLQGARALMWAMWDGLSQRWGNRNDLFR